MSMDEERSPKRPRFNSYSPASPAPPEAREYNHHIQTPPPSMRMSPSWDAQNLNTSQKRNHDSASGDNTSFPTPPSTAGLHSHSSLRGVGSDEGGGSGRQTPIAETEMGTKVDGDGDMEMVDSRAGAYPREGGLVDVEHRRTDHERQMGVGDTAGFAAPGAQSLYKLSTAPIVRSRPHASQNIISLYGLQDIQASVARKDPVTGAKINRLRKSYEGKLKMLGLEGRNKAQANQRELEGLAEEAWDEPGPDGRSYFDTFFEGIELGNANAGANLLASLSSAFTFNIGRLPGKDHEEWKNLLGLDDVNAANSATGKATPLRNEASSRPSAAATAIAKTAPSVAQRTSAPASPANIANRPDRTNKRRRYDDSSFEGYDNDDGYSTGGMDDRRGNTGQKRQKRKDFNSSGNSPAYAATGGGTPGGGMVGVRSS